MSEGRTRPDLDTHRQLELSLIRLLEVIGEAANRLSAEDRVRFPEVPWADIISLRNRLIHGYDAVDLDIVWQVVTGDLPTLIDQLAGREEGDAP